MAKTADRYAAEVRGRLPEPGDNPLQHLRHTVAGFADSVNDEDLAIMATSGIYPERTGLTWGDLAAILDWMERSEENLRPNHPAFPPR